MKSIQTIRIIPAAVATATIKYYSTPPSPPPPPLVAIKKVTDRRITHI